LKIGTLLDTPAGAGLASLIETGGKALALPPILYRKSVPRRKEIHGSQGV
jgi:hypothetical protein